MSTGLHKSLELDEIHRPHAWEYADATARTGASGFDSSDVGKLARQLDDNSLWMLTATTPTWQAVGGGGAPAAHATTHEPGGSDTMAVDAAAGTGSLRTLGTGAQQACAGNDARLSDARTPTAHATTHEPGGSDTMAVDAAAATGSLRTLGTGAQQACAGNDARLSDARTPTAHATTHQSGGSDSIKLDDLATPDDNTDLDATTSAHGLLPKLGGGTTNFLRADGAWTAPPGGTDNDAIHDNVAAEISAITEKTSPVDADLLLIEDSADSNNKKRVQIGNILGLGNMPAVHARRTTTQALTASWADVPCDTVDLESKPAILERNDTNTERIDVKENCIVAFYGTYSVAATHAASFDFFSHVRFSKNGTPVPATEVRSGNHYSLTEGVFEGDAVTVIAVIQCSAGDYVTMQVKRSGDTVGTVDNFTDITFGAFQLRGVKGDTGATGAAGADGDITWEGAWVSQNYTANQAVEYNGSSYVCHTNTTASQVPTDTNYWDLMASAGSPIFGTQYQTAQSATESTTTSGTYQQKLRLTTSSLPSGSYLVAWHADFGNGPNKATAVRFQEDDTTTLAEADVKQDSDGTYFWSAFSGHAIRSLNGVHNFDIDYLARSETARIKNATITVWRVS